MYLNQTINWYFLVVNNKFYNPCYDGKSHAKKNNANWKSCFRSTTKKHFSHLFWPLEIHMIMLLKNVLTFFTKLLYFSKCSQRLLRIFSNIVICLEFKWLNKANSTTATLLSFDTTGMIIMYFGSPLPNPDMICR